VEVVSERENKNLQRTKLIALASPFFLSPSQETTHHTRSSTFRFCFAVLTKSRRA
jgi:hypothetical protein